MQKILYYRLSPEVEKTLDRCLVKFDGGFAVRVAAQTFHGVDRIKERGVSEKQGNILKQIPLRRVLFKKEQISEVRVVKVNGTEYPVSVVVDDVVMAVHPKNLPEIARQKGYGTREGENWAVIKTILSRPNGDSGRKFVGEYEVAG
jgi:hypothetical protein